MRQLGRICSFFFPLVFVLATDVDASCASRESRVGQYAGNPQFIVVGCHTAHDYLAQDQAFLTALAENAAFAKYMAQRGFSATDLAITLRPGNEAGLAFMLNEKESTWYYKGRCEEVSLRTPVRLEIKQACSDTGYTFISFFQDVTIQTFFQLHKA